LRSKYLEERQRRAFLFNGSHHGRCRRAGRTLLTSWCMMLISKKQS